MEYPKKIETTLCDSVKRIHPIELELGRRSRGHFGDVVRRYVRCRRVQVDGPSAQEHPHAALLFVVRRIACTAKQKISVLEHTKQQIVFNNNNNKQREFTTSK